jgi:hypothetical protein
MTSRVLVSVRVVATPERAFEVFTQEIGSWWRPNALFQFTPRSVGLLAFEPGLGGRFTERFSDGETFEIGGAPIDLQLLFNSQALQLGAGRRALRRKFERDHRSTRVGRKFKGSPGVAGRVGSNHSELAEAFQIDVITRIG